MSENDNASSTGNVVEPALTAPVGPAATAAVDAPSVKATHTETARTASTPPPQKPPKSRSGSVFGTLLTLLLLIAVAALGYGYWQQELALNALRAEIAGQTGGGGSEFTGLRDRPQQNNAGLQEIESRLQALDSRSQETDSTLQDTSGSLQVMGDRLQETDSRLQQMDNRLQELDSSRQEMESSTQAMLRLQQTVEQQEQNQQQAGQQLLSQLAESNSRIASLTAQVNTINAELAATRQEVGRFGNPTADSVTLNEAESLLELARLRLLTARDVNSAGTLLNRSIELLDRIRTADVTAARRALAADLASINAVPEVDVEALYQRLADLGSQIDDLPVISGADNQEFVVPETGEVQQEEGGWLDGAVSILGKYFVVTRQDVEVVPLLTEEQQFFLRQRIELQLTFAQLALLNAEPEVYRTALAAARDSIEQWLQGPDDTKAMMLDALDALQETPIVVSTPDISASLNAVRQIVPLASSPAAAVGSEVVP